MNETWVNRNRKYGLVSYIHKTPKFYHFSVSCYKLRCKNQRCINCSLKIRFSSLYYNRTYNTFEECVKAIEEWYRLFVK